MRPVNAPPGSQEISQAHFSISAEKVSKRYNREWIFRNADLQFSSGKTYAVTGPNGSGKSTLLQVLWGQVPPTSGSLRYRKRDAEISIEEVYRHIAVATPYMDLIEELTLREMLAFHFKLKDIRQGLSPGELPSLMYLEDAMDKPLINFSSGMRQRLKLALAFYSAADVYFLDEPGTNLDRKAFEWYRAELGRLSQDALVIIASNNPDEYPADAIQIAMTELKQ